MVRLPSSKSFAASTRRRSWIITGTAGFWSTCLGNCCRIENVFNHEVPMSLRLPPENEIALTLTLSHRNGRGNFFDVKKTKCTSLLFLPSPACGRGKGEGSVRRETPYFRSAATNEWGCHVRVVIN